nr:IS5 family transposase [Streptomyces sp. NBC_00830]WTB29125.1 IS5 family transposase [Streptomyces sp. NBC_00830]WTB34879.1 IS5 family transposase [Streptomyces sp. NBC_00830]WTB35250.1 IS5 family transposase [Streptomyces sp. NBC_00830]
MLYAPELVDFNSPGVSCDCLAHRFGNAADQPERVPAYTSDMSDAEWAVTRDALPDPGWLRGKGGQPEGYCHRQMLDAIRYLVDNGIKWRSMPVDFPDWKRVYAFFIRWRDNQLVKEFHDRLRARTREAAGRDAEPTAGIIDAQSVKAAANVPAQSRGFDGGKLINGRRRHLVTDCIGLVLDVLVTPANTGERDAARILLPRLRARFSRLKLVWADGGYTGPLVTWAAKALNLVLQVVKRNDDIKGFVVIPRRWVVERTNGWLMRSRRLARDYETRVDSAEAMILFSMTMVMTRRLARPGQAGTAPSRP